MKLTPVMIEEILHRMETGQTTIADANAVRAYILSLLAAVDDDEAFEDEDDIQRILYGDPTAKEPKGIIYADKDAERRHRGRP